MNPGAIEEAGATARSFMDSMKEQPLALALAFMNIGLLIIFYYVAAWAGHNRESEFKAIMESNKEISKMLFNCVPVGQQRGEFKLQSDESHPFPLPPARPKEAPQ